MNGGALLDAVDEAFESCGIAPISRTHAVNALCAVYLVGSEAVTHCPRLLADARAAQRMGRILPGETPDPAFAQVFREAVRGYSKEPGRLLEWLKVTYNIVASPDLVAKWDVGGEG